MLHIVTLLEPFVLGICHIIYNKQALQVEGVRIFSFWFIQMILEFLRA